MSTRAKPADSQKPQGDIRDRVLRAGFEAFRELGFDGTSTLEIATRAKVSKRELYAEFGSKHGILQALIASTAERMKMPLAPPKRC